MNPVVLLQVIHDLQVRLTAALTENQQLKTQLVEARAEVPDGVPDRP